MAKHWWGRPGYRGHGDAKRYLGSVECQQWLNGLDDLRRSNALFELHQERDFDALQKKRDELAVKADSNRVLFHWSMFEDPDHYLRCEISELEAVIESRDAAGDSPEMRRRKCDQDRVMGYAEFLKSGLNKNAFSHSAPSKYFYNRFKLTPLSPRQIERELSKFEKASSRSR